MELLPGDTQAIIIIFEVFYLFINESLNTSVNLEALKGIWDYPWSIALIHSLRANRDLLISAPSILRYLLFDWQSAALSLPFKIKY